MLTSNLTSLLQKEVGEYEQYELSKTFGLDEPLKAVYSCSKQGTKGKLYITNNHVCFSNSKRGFPFSSAQKKAWPYDNILDVDKFNKKYLRLVTTQNKKYIFEITDDSLDKAFSILQRALYGVQGNSSLHIAVQERDLERAKQILELDPTKLNHYNRNEQTPLHIAIIKNDLDMVNLLLSYYEQNKDKCNINEGYGKTKNTILHTLCGLSNVEDEVFNAIIKYPHLDVEVVNSDDNTPLHYFCERNHSLNCKKLGALLISKAKNLDSFLNRINRNKESYMHKAVFNKKFRVFMVELLIKHSAKLDVKNDKGETPLHYAVRLGREDLCDILLKAGADPTVKTESNQTAREIADETYAHDKTSVSAYNIVQTLKNVDTLVTLLNNVGLSESIGDFLKHGLYDLYALTSLNREVLTSLGITLKLGPQIKLFKEIELLKQRIVEEEEVKREEEEKERKKKAMLPPDEDDASPTQDPEKVREELGLVDGNWEIEGSELEFTKKLGSGASGKVYRGLYKGKEVAIKVLTAVDAEDEMEEFRKEFLILTNVRSPHMVTFFGASIEPKLTMVMEYCQKGSLYHVLNNKQTDFTWDLSLNFCLEMALGMSELHGWKPSPIVHRDLKSLNLLVTQDWKIKVCDFGLSRFTGGNNLETFKKLCGTFAYCAPEIFNGGSFTDRSDVFSMGIVIWEILNRTMKGKYEQPYAEFNLVYDFQIIVQASQGLRPSPPPDTPTILLDLIKSCTDGDATKRPTAAEVVDKITEIKEIYKANQSEWDSLLPFNKKVDQTQENETVVPKLSNRQG